MALLIQQNLSFTLLKFADCHLVKERASLTSFLFFNSGLWTICLSYHTLYVFALTHSIISPTVVTSYCFLQQLHQSIPTVRFLGRWIVTVGQWFRPATNRRVTIHHPGMQLNNQPYLTSCTFNVTCFCDCGVTCKRTTVRLPHTSSLLPLNLAATTWFSPYCKQHPVTLNTSLFVSCRVECSWFCSGHFKFCYSSHIWGLGTGGALPQSALKGNVARHGAPLELQMTQIQLK